MSNYNEAITRRMIVSLINAYADSAAGGGKIEHTRKMGRYDGLVQGVHYALTIMDIAPGAAPFSVEADVLAVVREVGDRPPFTTGNEARKQWVIDMTERLLNLWTSGDEAEVNNLAPTVAGFLNGLLAGGTTNMVDDR